jgi:hypothetical protein
MTKYLFLIAYSVCSNLSFGQNTNFTVKEIDSIVKRIDSTCIRAGIVDYTFHNIRHKKKIIGGGADWFYTDTSRTKLLKAVKETSLASESIDIYYFYNDSLIYLTITNRTYTEDKNRITWQGQYYFQNSNLIFKQGELNFVFNPKSYLETARKFFSPDQFWRRGN